MIFFKQENSSVGFSISRFLILEETQMYGLVNKAVESLVLSKFGKDTWDVICE